ncbi:two-component sensor histidine kinase BarA [Duffyella gerundensis]|uniref:two-component sensor histidine kinase BarA n=1 Tax=Duffyella gerundensis TaxID=1619313 RepID=UPI0021F7DEE6|nr:two-component sensor histidine kinase BarA [Duffyella gerundensis]
MTKYSLRARMMILILAPTLMIGLLLSTFFVVHRYNELQRQLMDAGANIIEPLAVSSEYGMASHSRDAVRELVSLLHRRHSAIVRAITVFDDNNEVFVTSNYQQHGDLLRLPAGVEPPQALASERHGNVIILRTPILSETWYPDEMRGKALKPTGNPLGYVAIELDLQSVRLQQYKEVFVSTLLLLFCLCIAMLFAYRLMRDVTGPIRNMVSTVDRIRRGQLDSRVEGHMLGELDILKNGINSMAMSLTAYHEEMQHNIDQATSDLRETLEQMEIQNVELDLARKRAQEAARIKSEFLANMSHELRTPLNGVIGFTRQTLKTPLSATQRDYLNTIERSANNLLSIINDVLDFSKLEAGKLVLESIPFPLRATLDETIVLLAPSAHEKGLEITISLQSDVPDNVIGDPLRLQQIVTNLIGNAVKFTERGNIALRIDKRAQNHEKIELTLRVQDSGIGIAEEQQSQLFQAFRQADASISRRHGGTGLGLVITQRLANEMGGDITFQSRPNEGSTFWVHFSLDLNPNASSNPHALMALQGKRLAYVEENAIAAQATLNMLSSTPLEVNYGTSLNALPDAHFDILLMGMPVSRQPRAIPAELLQRQLAIANSVIMALPSQMLIYAEELKARGIDACIAKPVTYTRLMPIVLELHTRTLYDLPPSTRLPLTVLAVDDNPANLKLIGALLQEQVEHTLLCDSGEQAIAIARQQRLDVILMDIQMPEIDGIRASEIIRAMPQHQHTPIVAVTAHAIDGDREHLIKAGMNDYLAKPINEQKLALLLARYSPGVIHESQPVPHLQLPSLDWSLALRQAANKTDLAEEMLGMLLDFLPDVAQQVEQFMEQKDAQRLRDIIHKLHGSASYSGVPRLKQLCLQLEKSLRQQEDIAEFEPEIFELLDEMENVAREAKRLLAR